MPETERALIIAWLRQKSTEAATSATQQQRRARRHDLETESLAFALAADAIVAGAHRSGRSPQ